ncbi:MAG TPA: CRTAC1 family protein [Opitutaceae bacterium]|nr:CRTAC1 family protein [Opitutaceae bacterium]
MNHDPATSISPALRSAAPPVRAAVPPLVPVVLPLVIAAIALSILFARLFPAGTRVAPQLRFTDVTEQAGLAFAPWRDNSESPTTLGSAVAVLDFDNDGHPDLFFVSGTAWPWEEALGKRVSRGSLALFRNDGTGRFTDVTAVAGLNVELQGMSTAAGDFDNDGLVDLYVTCVGTNHLFRNRGNGRFEDVTEQAGVGGEENTWSTGAAWIDIDGDARLDLVVAHYARWPEEVGLSQAFLIADVGRSYGAHTGFVSVFPTVYRNLGDGRFEAVPDSAGIRDIDPATGLPVAFPLAVVPVDADGDARLDLLFSYHTGESALFVNDGRGRFEKTAASHGRRQEGASAGLASASAGSFAAEGGVDERSRVLQSLAGIGAPTNDAAPAEFAAKFGVAVADLDLGGHWEVVAGDGRGERAVNKFDTGREFAAPARVLWHDGTSWQPAPADDNIALSQPLVARGVAVADFDGDGDPDIVVTQSGGPPRLLRNDQRLGQPWLRVQLKPAPGRGDASGARVELHTPRRVMTQTVAPAMGLFAQSESTLTFGLGDDTRVRRIVVQWPSGQRQEVRPAAVNSVVVIAEP